MRQMMVKRPNLTSNSGRCKTVLPILRNLLKAKTSLFGHLKNHSLAQCEKWDTHNFSQTSNQKVHKLPRNFDSVVLPGVAPSNTKELLELLCCSCDSCISKMHTALGFSDMICHNAGWHYSHCTGEERAMVVGICIMCKADTRTHISLIINNSLFNSSHWP